MPSSSVRTLFFPLQQLKLKSWILEGALKTRKGASFRAPLGQFLPTFTWEKWEDTKLPRNKWTPHIHFRGTSFSHYIAINSTGCGLYLVCSWSRPRDMRLLTHDSSLIFILAPHHICPKTNLFLSEKENSSSPNHGIRQRGMLAYAADKLRWKNGHFDSQFFGLDLIQSSVRDDFWMMAAAISCG